MDIAVKTRSDLSSVAQATPIAPMTSAAQTHRHRSTRSLLVIVAGVLPAEVDTASAAATLKNLNAAMRRAVREGDVISQFAPGRFALLIQRADARGALRLARRIQAAVSAHRDASVAVPKSVAIGIATTDSVAIPAQELLHHADAAAAEAMAHGLDGVRLRELESLADTAPDTPAPRPRIEIKRRFERIFRRVHPVNVDRASQAESADAYDARCPAQGLKTRG